MLLTISTTHQPATDLGYLLHKNPKNTHHAPLAFGDAHVFFPVANENECTAVLLVDIDPIKLTKEQKKYVVDGFPLHQYVNDRTFVASSFMSVAIVNVLRSAIAGRCDAKPELTQTQIPLRLQLPVLSCSAGAGLIDAIFTPLGYQVEISQLPLDDEHPEWGESSYYAVTLTIKETLHTVLSHLYVLIPVFDNAKHYWIGEDEVEKLLHHGDKWLRLHPEKALITSRYLKKQTSLTEQALQQLSDSTSETTLLPGSEQPTEATLEAPIKLNQKRIDAIYKAIEQAGISSVIDLGCGEGKCLLALIRNKKLLKLAGVDVSTSALERAEKRIRYHASSALEDERLTLFQSALTYRDQRCQGYDCATLIEVIEHIDPAQLPVIESIVFAYLVPNWVIVTTPNVEYNFLLPGLGDNDKRHPDHRFEWTRAEFQEWTEYICQMYQYEVTLSSIGEEDPNHGAPTQMATFRKMIGGQNEQ